MTLTQEQVRQMQVDFTRIMKREVTTEWFIDCDEVLEDTQQRKAYTCMYSDLYEGLTSAAQLKELSLHHTQREVALYEVMDALYTMWHKVTYAQGGASLRECKRVMEDFLMEFPEPAYRKCLLYAWEHMAETATSDRKLRIVIKSDIAEMLWQQLDGLKAKYPLN